MGDRTSWEAEAENWVRWARAPGHDAYWYYRDAFFDVVVPAPKRTTLEVGCGEGRVTRDLAARGHRVLSVDGSATLLRHAVEADPDGRCVLGDASSLPVGDASVDLVVAYNSLMDFDDMPRAVAEVARVLEPGAVFCMCVTHPLFDTGSVEDLGDALTFVMRKPYLGRRRFDVTVTRRGLAMRFRGWSHALEDYFSALSAAGFVVEALREPVPTPGIDDPEHWRRVPMFLHLRAVKC